MADSKNLRYIKIEGPELEELRKLCEDLQDRMTAANSDIAYQAYKNARRVLSQYYIRGQVEYQKVIDADARKAAREKRAARKGE
jgi:hypothetical protein